MKKLLLTVTMLTVSMSIFCVKPKLQKKDVEKLKYLKTLLPNINDEKIKVFPKTYKRYKNKINISFEDEPSTGIKGEHFTFMNIKTDKENDFKSLEIRCTSFLPIGQSSGGTIIDITKKDLINNPLLKTATLKIIARIAKEAKDKKINKILIGISKEKPYTTLAQKWKHLFKKK